MRIHREDARLRQGLRLLDAAQRAVKAQRAVWGATFRIERQRLNLTAYIIGQRVRVHESFVTAVERGETALSVTMRDRFIKALER